MKKKALKSKRNRHTGRINSYKANIIRKSTHEKVFSDGVKMVGMYIAKGCGLSMVRVN
jgi:hypothetical protein